MSARQAPPRLGIRKILGVAALALALLAGAFTALLAAADAGWLDRPVQRWVSHKLGRRVIFRALHVHLLSARPRLEVEGLAIANPAWIGRGSVATVARLNAEFRLAAMLRGVLEPTALAIRGLELHLVRLAPGRNNWSFGKARKGERAFGVLRDVQHLTIEDGHVALADLTRKLRLIATLSHGGGGPMPLLFEGQGELDGVPLRLGARGGALNGDAVDRPYPFVARLIDGATIIDARGTSGEPFDLTSFTLAMNARGPNLADLGYLFNLRTPNSPPFRLATTAQGDGARFTFKPLEVHFGASDAAGWIRSDHASQRHRATAELWSAVLTKGDLRSVFAPIPPRASARSRSGAVPVSGADRWILPDAPFPVANLRTLDLLAQVHVRAIRGYPLPVNEFAVHIALDDGKLTYSGVHAELFGGRLAGNAVLDVHGRTPALSVAGGVSGMQLARLPASAKARLSGELAVTARLAGIGRSIHDAAATAAGTAEMHIRRGSMPPATAFMLGGDMLGALRALGNVRRPIALDCLSARFRAVDGRLATNSLTIRTAAGDTLGRGVLDLRNEQVNFTLTGDARQHRLLKLAMPILIQGPATRPRASVLPTRNAARLGLKGKLGIAISPLAALLPVASRLPRSLGAGRSRP